MKLDGKPFQVSLPAKDSVQRFLDRAAKDEIFTPANLCSKLSLPTSSLKDVTAKLPSYTFKVGITRYWGSPAAIKELKRQVGC